MTFPTHVNANGVIGAVFENKSSVSPSMEKHSEVSLQLGESMTVGKVTKRAIGPDRTVAATCDEAHVSML